MCNCRNISMGSYGTQIIVEYRGKRIGIDSCILSEIKTLWDKGVITIESCCGHNVTKGYIAVIGEHIPMMLSLGYERDPNQAQSFYPLTK